MAEPRIYQNLIGGEWVASRSGNTYANVNPADTRDQITSDDIETVDSPAQVTLPNSCNQGVLFNVGGSITLDSTTVGGTYSGTINVTVDYQ